jgi:hypothetical protein
LPDNYMVNFDTRELPQVEEEYNPGQRHSGLLYSPFGFSGRQIGNSID